MGALLTSRPVRRVLKWSAWSAFAIALVIGLTLATLLAFNGRAEDQQSTLAKLISQMLSSKTSTVTIGAVDGPLSSNATIRNVVIADKNGAWLKVDRVKLVWSRLALLRRRLEVDELEISKLEILRKPLPADVEAAAADTEKKEPILPELPVKVIVKSFKLGELSLGPSLAGIAVKLTASGELKLGAPSEGLDVKLAARRLDGDGASKIEMLFVPKGEKLTLDVEHREAEGGILAHVASIPGLPPVALTLKGSGPLDKFAAKLDFNAGDTIGAKGEASLLRQGAARRLQLDLTSRIEGLLPPLASGIFAGATTLKGEALLGDDGSIKLPQLRLAAELAELVISGDLDKDKKFDLSVLARALANQNGETRRGGVRIGKLDFKTRARGTFDSPVVDGSFVAQNVFTPNGGVNAATVQFSVKPDANGILDVTADGEVNGLQSPQKGLAQAAGKAIRAIVRARVDKNGKVDIAQSRLQSSVYDINYAGAIDGGKITGTVTGALHSLAAFSTLASRPLKGKATINADLAGDTKQKTWDIGLRTQATGLSLGSPAINRIAGGALALKGRIKTAPKSLALEKLSLIGRGFEARADGMLGQGGKGLRFNIIAADSRRIDPRLRGEAEIAGVLSGALNNPNGAVELHGERMSALGKPVRKLVVRVEAAQLLGALRGRLTMGGEIDNRKLTGSGDLAKRGDGGWTLTGLAIALGTAKVSGNADIAPAGTATGQLTVKAPDLNHLSALLLTRIRGSLDADIALDAADGRQNAKVKAKARGIVFQQTRLGSAAVDITARDVLNKPAIAGAIKAANIRAAGETIGQLDVTAKGSAAETAFTARARGGSLRLDSTGAIRNGATTSIYLRSLALVRRGVRVRLGAPATLQMVDGGVRTKSLALIASGGRIALSGLAGKRLDLKVAISNLPLSVAKAANPKLSLAGRLKAQATLTGSAASPRGAYSIAIAGLATPETRKAGVPRLAINASGQLQGSKATVTGTIRGGRRINLRVDGAVPLGKGGPLSVGVNGTIDAALANASLASSGQRVAGKLALNLKVGGTGSRPSVSGSGRLSGGSFRDPLQGVSLSAISGQFTGRGDRLTIDRVSARTPNGGTIGITGTVGVNPAAGFPANLRINAQKAQLISNEIMTLVSGLDLTVTGPLATAPVIRGAVNVRSLNVTIPSRLPASAAPLRGAKHIAPPPQTRARLKALAAARRAAARRKRARASGPRIDILIDAPNQVFVRGRGVDAELGGRLRVAGTANAPRANGGFEIRRGRIDLLTQRIDFTRGKLTFRGDIIPELDFIASSVASGVTASVTITGRADNPKFGFSSEPVLPPDEVMAYLLFQKAAASLKPFEAVQLAAAVATLTGNGGPGVLDKARRALGVDTLDVSAGGANGPSVGASRYISKRISVGVKAGTNAANSEATVKVDVTRRIKLLGAVGGDGRTSIGIGTEIEY